MKLSVKNEIMKILSKLQKNDEFKYIGSKTVTSLDKLFELISKNGKIDEHNVKILG